MKIVISGDPVGKIRHRAFIRNGKISCYDSQQRHKTIFQNKLSMACIQQSFKIQECPLYVDLIFQIDAFLVHSKAVTNLRQWDILTPTKKPDLDNMEKFVLDCGNNILWPDDRFITELSSKKIYSNKPCTIITINPIPRMVMSKEQENVFKTFSPDELKDLELDMYCIGKNYEENDQIDSKDIFKHTMASTADSLIKFVDKWMDKLKKIKGK